MNDDDTLNPPAHPLAAKPQQWAILELMGHQRIAGALSQDVTSGLPLVRVDVPAVTRMVSVWRNGAYVEEPRTMPAHSRSLSASAIYAINWVDEAAARLAAVEIMASPLKLFSLQSALESVPEPDRQYLLRLSQGSSLVAASAEGGDDDHF